MTHRLNINKQFMIGNGLLAFAVIIVVAIFVYLSLREQHKQDAPQQFPETYTITLCTGFTGESLSLLINDSTLIDRIVDADSLTLSVKRFAEQSVLFIVDNATQRSAVFELSDRGGAYRFEREDGTVKLLPQNRSAR
ncbi:MAG: hypothetical protein LBL78_05510 [Prevotellaceae bacterium]|jgi:hypothetical protein|nr:hypothetical protein [Prevotellaceae bacterium]